MTSTEKGSAPRESGFIDGAFSSATSSVVNRIAAAPILSTMYVICVVPEMGTIQGFCTISHDSAICGNSLFPHGTSLHKRPRAPNFFADSLSTFVVNSYRYSF